MRQSIYLKCTVCGSPLELGRRHKVIALTEDGRDCRLSIVWRADRTEYLCDECFARVMAELPERGER